MYNRFQPNAYQQSQQPRPMPMQRPPSVHMNPQNQSMVQGIGTAYQRQPSLQSNSGQFGGMFQNPQMTPFSGKMQNKLPNYWGSAQNGFTQQQKDPIPDAVWGAMGLWQGGQR